MRAVSGPRWEGALVAGAALLVRIAYFAAYRDSSFFVAPVLDSAGHDLMARALAGGDWTAGAPYFRPPLYPWLLGALYALVGAGPWPGRLLSGAAGVATALAVWEGARRLGLGRGARLAVALAMAVWPVELFLEGELLGTPVATALATWGLVLVLGTTSSPETRREGTPGKWFGAGVLWGLAALARAPLALLPGGGAVLALVGPGRRFRSAGAVLAGALLIWAGPAALMATHGAGFRFPSLQGGVNFYAGNHPGADGRSVRVPGMESARGWREFEAESRRAAGADGVPASPADADRAWWERGLSYWRNDPAGALALLARKGVFAVHGYEGPNNRSLYRARDDAFLPLTRWPGAYWPFGLLFPLAAVGAVAVRRRREWWPVLAQALLVGLPLVLFFVNARFRLPAVPALLLLAVPGVLLLRRGSRPAWVAFVLLYALSNAPWPGAIREDGAREALARGESALNAGRLPEAETRYREALALDPGEGRAHLGLAVAAAREGHFEDANREFTRASTLGLAGYWALEEAWASSLDLQGRTEEAALHRERAVAGFPESAALWGQLGLTWEALGREADARDALEEAIVRDSRNPEVWNSVGRLRLLAGDSEGAGAAWDRALELDPRHYKALFNRGLWHLTRGERTAADADLERAADAATDPADRERARQLRERLPSSLP